MKLETFIKQEADQCVKCGLCLPVCPTYNKTRDEGDSPRGRIALMQGLVGGQLQLTNRLEYHLDRCLTCRACEHACPSNVHYGQLIDAARSLVASSHHRSQRPRLVRGLEFVATHPRLLRAGARLLRLYQRLGIRWLSRRSGLLKLSNADRLEAMLPDIPKSGRWKPYYPPIGTERARVALFTGCFGNVIDRDALVASIRLLTRYGIGVHVPDGQSCCGALHAHSGDSHQAQTLAQKNLATFNNLDVEAIVFTASGCGAALFEISQFSPNKTGFRVPVMDISQYVANMALPNDIAFKPLKKRVAIHSPCSLKHVLRQAQHPSTLLEHIPGIELVRMTNNNHCCGAAGSYMLSQGEMSDSLRDDSLQDLIQLDADILVTSNFGCAMHLRAGMEKHGMSLDIMHPVTLLERQTATETY